MRTRYAQCESTLSGPAKQQTGIRAEHYVQMLLSDGGITSGEVSPDHGEDFLIEVDGAHRASTGAPPLTALVQVKGHATNGPEGFAKERSIKRKHLLRWSAQPLPVFLVAVYLGQSDKRIYVESIDSFLAERFGAYDISTLDQKEFTVPLQETGALADFLRDKITEHHRTAGPQLEHLSPSELQDNHIEIIDRSTGIYSPTWHCFNWKVIWKSPRRPVFFAAALRWLMNKARSEHAGERKPVQGCFHIYRSLSAVQANTAVARVDFVDTKHPLAAKLLAKQQLDPVRIRAGSESEAIRTLLASRTATPKDYAKFARELGAALDRVTISLLQASDVKEAEQSWTPDLRRQYRQLDEKYRSGPHAPLELEFISNHLRDYLFALHGHFRFAVEIRDIPWIRTQRRVRDAREELHGFYKAWRPLLASKSW